MIGTSISRYRILERLGAGGMGEVFLAEDARLGRRVALKLLPAQRLADPQAHARLLQEARAAASLDHPNVCAIYEVDDTADGRTFIAMAHYDGETLDARVAREPLSVPEALAIAEQIAAGLAHAHARGIVHRDIKPSNVILTREGVVKILDFGLAKISGSTGLTTTGTSVGTPGYMSPEQVRGENVDGRADLWAFGVLLYFLLAQRLPFEAEGMTGVMFAILEREPFPLAEAAPSAPPAVEGLIARCLRKSPSDRYASADELLLDLRRITRALASGANADTIQLATPVFPIRPASGLSAASAPTPQESRRPRRPVFAIATIASAVIVIAAGWFAWRARAGTTARVGVMPPRVTSADSSDHAAEALGIEAALVRALGQLRGVSVFDPSQLRTARDAPEAARLVQADALVQAEAVVSGEDWRVTLRRLAPDGTVSGSRIFSAPSTASLDLANAISTNLAALFPERRPAKGSTAGSVTAADFEEFTRLYVAWRSTGSARMDPDELRKQMRALAERSPRFLDAAVLACDYAVSRHRVTQSPEDLAVADWAAARARSLAPREPRSLRVSFDAALEHGDLAAARGWLEALRASDPGDVEVLVRESALNERAGKPEAALVSLRAAARRRPSLSIVQKLADLEVRQGLHEEARVRLDSLVARFPAHRFPRSKLAQLELLYGRPGRADTLYSILIEQLPGQIAYLSNRGLARLLERRFAAAAEDFRASHALAPENAGVLLNLADALQLLGRADTAAVIYRDVLTRTSADPEVEQAGLQLTRAQCFAHLERGADAVAAVQKAMRRAPEDADALYQAALVYALLGERASAIATASRAIEKGVAPGWFALPWFDSVRGEPEFPRRRARG